MNLPCSSSNENIIFFERTFQIGYPIELNHYNCTRKMFRTYVSEVFEYFIILFL